MARKSPRSDQSAAPLSAWRRVLRSRLQNIADVYASLPTKPTRRAPIPVELVPEHRGPFEPPAAYRLFFGLVTPHSVAEAQDALAKVPLSALHQRLTHEESGASITLADREARRLKAPGLTAIGFTVGVHGPGAVEDVKAAVRELATSVAGARKWRVAFDEAAKENFASAMKKKLVRRTGSKI